MSYTINKTDGSILTTVNDGTINTSSSSLTLIGKNYAGYGELQNENFIQMLENFANSTTPANPLAGQLYFNTTNKSLNVFIGGGTWKSVGSIGVSGTPPGSPAVGELWFDTVNEQLFAWNGTSWVLIGPISSATAPGFSGFVSGTVTNGAATEYVLKEYVAGKLIAVISPKLMTSLVNVVTELPGYGLTILRPGYNFVAEGQLVDTGVGVYNTKKLEVGDNAGLVYGNVAEFTVSAAAAGNATIKTLADLSIVVANGAYVGTVANTFSSIPALTISKNATALQAPTAGTTLHIAQADGTASRVTLDSYGASNAYGFRRASGTAAAPTAVTTSSDMGHITWAGYGTNAYQTGKATISGVASENWTNTANGMYLSFTTTAIGASSPVERLRISEAGLTTTAITAGADGTAGTIQGNWTLVGASKLQATYADLAERYEADRPYLPGTIVRIGGEKEVTEANEELCEDVFGVVSSAPAFVLNSAAGGDDTHPPIALVGRVPVRVRGLVQKGDLIVCAGLGLGRAAKKGEATQFNVVGRALEANNENTEKLITVAIK